MLEETRTTRYGLYDASFEHDNCGIGAIIQIKGIKTHQTIEDALTIVEQLAHRAGKDAAGEVGDGVGISFQVSHSFFRDKVAFLQEEKGFGVGMFFLPQDEERCHAAMHAFEQIVAEEGLLFLGWRKVPIEKALLQGRALKTMPAIYQAFIHRDESCMQELAFDRKLYILRRQFENKGIDSYVCSLSCRTIVYKGMLLVQQLRHFYLDLKDEHLRSAIALVHSRFSTNTFPSWERAHPNRLLVHNGEINTIKGNVHKMLSREGIMHSPYLDKDKNKLTPIIDLHGSDSARLDNAIEYFIMAGMPLPKAMMLTLPQPWEHDESMSKEKRAFYQYYATMMEPWDGPASILFSDGVYAGAILDRNGLRPSRYYITKQDTLIISSEVGVLDIPQQDIVVKDRLQPGKMLLVDTQAGRLIQDEELKQQYAREYPYAQWLKDHLMKLEDLHLVDGEENALTASMAMKLKKYFGYGYEDVMNYLLPFAESGSEPVIAMGNDTPLAVLSKKQHPLFDYFKQLFAQVTNPPIDAIREEFVTSTSVYLGTQGNLLIDDASNCHRLKLDNPILSQKAFLRIKHMQKQGFQVQTLSLLYVISDTLHTALHALFEQAKQAIAAGCNLLILSDRGVDEQHAAIPSLLAVSAMQQYLNRIKKRAHVDLVVESGEPREVHHFAVLLGYGASAIYPYLALYTLQELIEQQLLHATYEQAEQLYCQGIVHGIVKIASKMGISTIQSYQGAQVFEAIGISREVIDVYFTDTISRIEGITLQDIEQDNLQKHQDVFALNQQTMDGHLDSKGVHKQRMEQEQHLYNPETITLLQTAVRENDYQQFKAFSKLLQQEMDPVNLRSLWRFKQEERLAIPLDEVESAEAIVKRFKTGAMSYGSISKEAHETLAIAMNMLHGKSNTGEGGEDESRYESLDGKNRCSAIKQIASGRFGVTSSYLNHAVELQIKMAQGAKPGEGGQLPAGKVYPWIAKTRHATPGVSLISPPPHHDIYSIEDLAQLIYDLKCANPQARISVKLVSEAGVGTIAAGVAKAGADVILISGHDGGTGAAPKNSVYHAGLPWELGLAEVQQTLLANALRDHVVLETDGKLLTGKDVVIAALLGAQEYGFATGPLVSMGCVMMRVCHLDTCPVGIATQNPELRKRFQGKAEHVVRFLFFIAEEMREIMASLGFRTIEEMIGHKEILAVNDKELPRKLNFQAIFETAEDRAASKKHPIDLHNHIDETILWKQIQPYFQKGMPQKIQVKITNKDRAFGTMFGSRITKAFGSALKDDTYIIEATGSAGQSFGAFIPRGLTLTLHGDANDYVGKGLSGGHIIVRTPVAFPYPAQEHVIIGNVALYGATSGKAYINGKAGERFAIRNSGAIAVVEGVGDHALEYMTGGCVVIIGSFGKNIAAGMSGGVAYILDEHHKLPSSLAVTSIQEEKDIKLVKQLVEEHVQATASKKASTILADFSAYLPMFKKIIPVDYELMTKQIAAYQQLGYTVEDAQMQAFTELRK